MSGRNRIEVSRCVQKGVWTFQSDAKKKSSINIYFAPSTEFPISRSKTNTKPLSTSWGPLRILCGSFAFASGHPPFFCQGRAPPLSAGTLGCCQCVQSPAAAFHDRGLALRASGRCRRNAVCIRNLLFFAARLLDLPGVSGAAAANTQLPRPIRFWKCSVRSRQFLSASSANNYPTPLRLWMYSLLGVQVQILVTDCRFSPQLWAVCCLDALWGEVTLGKEVPVE